MNRRLEFHYQVVRVWQIPLETVITSGLGLLPLATLADVPEETLPAVIHRIGERLAQEASPEQEAVLWTSTFVLTGLRLPEETLTSLFQGVRLMRESSAYAVIHKEAALMELKKMSMIQGRKRFGPPEPATVTALESIMDVERLERMVERLLDVTTWDELLATP